MTRLLLEPLELGKGMERERDVYRIGELRARAAGRLAGAAEALALFRLEQDDIRASRRGEVVRHARAHDTGSDDDHLGSLAHP